MTPKEIVSLFKKLKSKVNLVIARDSRYESNNETVAIVTKDYENLKQKYEKLEKDLEELTLLRENLQSKELEIENLNTELNRVQHLERSTEKPENFGHDTESLQLELNSNREYLEYILQHLEQYAPELMQRISNEYNSTTQDDTNYSDSLNDEEWC